MFMFWALFLQRFKFFDLTVFVLIQYGENGAFQVVVDNYVKEEEGTGVVHQAPYFGAVSELCLFCLILLNFINHVIMRAVLFI